MARFPLLISNRHVTPPESTARRFSVNSVVIVTRQDSSTIHVCILMSGFFDGEEVSPGRQLD
jgi:hypothetical protein